ncbi:MAG: myo-inositol 2-dehydrogenase/D-chiro-inositol 1-dehydrogenase [Pirellulaceae bacterium]|jgi:myo-inositol 2-dehydrogenase/D-chiro-inositol 1-dehydrogenase
MSAKNEKAKEVESGGRRKFLQGAVGAAAGIGLFDIVPRHVLGGPDHTPPSETFGAALIGVGGRGPGTFKDLSGNHKLNIRKIAECDVKFVGSADNKTRYTDFRRLLERKDLDIVAIATPPHWHALISIAAMDAGKDVLCEKPMTRFIAEGRAVIEAVKRTGQVFQIGTYGRFGEANGSGAESRKIIRAGFAKGREVRVVKKGGFKVKQWSGPINVTPAEPPKNLDWDLYCGPSPLRPFHSPRFGGMHRGYWDYDGGGLGDMGQHYLDPIAYRLGKDNTHPIKVEVSAPPAHPDVTGPWGWVKFTYADGVELILDSGEWGEPSGLEERRLTRNDLTAAEQSKLDGIPNEEKMIGFGEAVKTRRQPGGNAEAAHYTSSIMHLANVAIRTGRTIQFDPKTERAIGDEEANRIINQPMRAPWHL